MIRLRFIVSSRFNFYATPRSNHIMMQYVDLQYMMPGEISSKIAIVATYSQKPFPMEFGFILLADNDEHFLSLQQTTTGT